MKEYKHYFKKHNQSLNRRKDETDEEYDKRIKDWERYKTDQAIHEVQGIEILRDEIRYALDDKKMDNARDAVKNDYERGYQDGVAHTKEFVLKQCEWWIDILQMVADDPLEYEITLVGGKYEIGKRQ